MILFSFCILGNKGIRSSEKKHFKLDTTTIMIGIIVLTQVSIVLILLITCTYMYLLESCKDVHKNPKLFMCSFCYKDNKINSECVISRFISSDKNFVSYTEN